MKANKMYRQLLILNMLLVTICLSFSGCSTADSNSSSNDKFNYESYADLETKLLVYSVQVQKINDDMLAAEGEPFALEPLLREYGIVNPKLEAVTKSISELEWNSVPADTAQRSKAKAFHNEKVDSITEMASRASSNKYDLVATTLVGLALMHQARADQM